MEPVESKSNPAAPTSYTKGLRALERCEMQAIELLRIFPRTEPVRSIFPVGSMKTKEWLDSLPAINPRASAIGVRLGHMVHIEVPDGLDEEIGMLQDCFTYISEAFAIRRGEGKRYKSDLDRLLYISLTVGSLLADLTTRLQSDTWRLGKKAREDRARGGAATKKLADPHEQALLMLIYEKHMHKKASLNLTAKELKLHNINVSSRTVGDRLKELGKR